MSFDTKTGSFERMKLLNQSTVLNMIRLREPISRAEIAKLTKLTPPTVSSLVSELIEKNLITEEQSTSSTSGGRKPIMLRINYSAHYIIGVYAAAEVIRVILTTMDGNIVSDFSKDITELPSKVEFMSMIIETIHQILRHTNVEKDLILGIGFAMHGLVDPDKGIAIFSPHLHLENIPIKDTLENEFDIPVIVENDVRALAKAESWFGQGQGVSDFISLSVGRGIGSGIYINNEIYKSSFNTAGEIGHTILDVNGPKCQCGNNGCLEAYASESAILNRVKAELRNHSDSLLHEWLKDRIDELDLKMIFKAAREDDFFAKLVLEEAGQSLGLAAANMINILKPAKLIVEGSIFEAGDFVLAPLKKSIEKYTFKSSNEDISVVCSNLGKTGMVLGAVTLVLQKMFKTDEI
ncbi:ROK family transcriptional regulator [Paenibacillus sp. BSR1-1]|uniref:ROK family transcriptional regulator n=1 Tax=Paenibacillus sp. BSR1-1 TaxID=3020845 RepID=UPI0025B0DC43|nr:ROK family transcriptional regulator [Paenibacillus sp. BSR1-1]MDN3017287.1 ROK family transcriptional regulator [Paenibacillus sp. BSR1-1]